VSTVGYYFVSPNLACWLVDCVIRIPVGDAVSVLSANLLGCIRLSPVSVDVVLVRLTCLQAVPYVGLLAVSGIFVRLRKLLARFSFTARAA
jgi:hypothetical protein